MLRFPFGSGEVLLPLKEDKKRQPCHIYIKDQLRGFVVKTAFRREAIRERTKCKRPRWIRKPRHAREARNFNINSKFWLFVSSFLATLTFRPLFYYSWKSEIIRCPRSNPIILLYGCIPREL